MMVPVLPAALWLLAAAFLILLILVIFGYHLYQRSRMKALSAASGSLGELMARKERLEADAAELRRWQAEQKSELQKLEGERHSQEILRSGIAQLNRELEKRKKESEQALKCAADLDILIVKKRNLLSRLEAEVKAQEQIRAEMGPLEKAAQNLRTEIEQGKIRTALLAEQELRTANLQQLAYSLGHEIEELQRTLEPLRHEKNRLHLFIEQARHASSVKNERILEQNEEIRNLELAKSELRRETGELADKIDTLTKEEELATQRLAEAESARTGAEAEAQKRQEEIAGLEGKLAEEKQALSALMERREEAEWQLGRLGSRMAALETELAKESRPEKKRAAKREARVIPKSSSPGRARSRGRPEQIFAGSRTSHE